MKASALITYSLCLITSFAGVAGESYTNLAGKAIAATPVKVEGGQVTFSLKEEKVKVRGEGEQWNRKPSNPQTLTLPLRVFPQSEQARIKAAVGIREMPGELKGLAAEIASQRARYEARAKAGKLSQEKLAENLEMLAGSWRHAVEETNLRQEEKAYWMAEGLKR